MGTVSFEIPGPGTYQVTCDPKLDPLANAGTAADILRGKQFYNDQNQVVTGTMEPGTDTGDATATAGDILAPKTAYTAAGKVTGTIPTKGAGDLTTAGATVSVPAGYYPESVYKTVTDPDLTAGNIKEGVEILGVTGSLRAQYVGILVVTVDSGAEVTATDGTTTLTETSNGTATFHLPNGGTWTVTATLNGNHSPPETVAIQEDLTVSLSPGGSTTVTVPTQYAVEPSFLPTYTIALNIDPVGGGTVTGAGKYLEGQQVTVKATPAEGYQFVAWKENENKPSRLPEGYAEVEYIESTSGQYIDTGIKPTETLKFEIDIEPSTDGGSEHKYIAYSYYSASNIAGGTAYSFSILWTSGGIGVKTGSHYNTNKDLTELGPSGNTQRLSVVVDYKNKYASVNDVVETSIGTNVSPSMDTICILGRNTGNYCIDAKIYSCKIENSGEVVREFVPCVHPSGIVGLYDLIEDKFYVDNGGGVFTAGPAVDLIPDMHTEAEYSFTATRDLELVAMFEPEYVLGRDWFEATIPETDNWESVTYGDGKFVTIAYNSDKAAYSLDGVNWTMTTLPKSAYWTSVAYGDGKFVAVEKGYTLSSTKIAAYSLDGITWTQTVIFKENWKRVAYGDGKFVAMPSYGTKVGISTDGITWTSATLSSTGRNLGCIAYGNGKFVIVGRDISAYSTNGTSWGLKNMVSTGGWISTVYGKDRFVTVKNGKTDSAYSLDGITWIASVLSASANWTSVAYGGDKFVAIAYNGNVVAYSSDGVIWEPAVLPSSAPWECMAYGNGKFVALAFGSNKIVYSSAKGPGV